MFWSFGDVCSKAKDFIQTHFICATRIRITCKDVYKVLASGKIRKVNKRRRVTKLCLTFADTQTLQCRLTGEEKNSTVQVELELMEKIDLVKV